MNVILKRLAILALALVLIAGCKDVDTTSAASATSRPAGAAAKPASKPVPAIAPAAVTRKPTDITFIVASDVHLGVEGIEARNRTQIAAMNAIPGKAYPPAVGGKVGKPLGVLIAGDLTDWGDPEQWKAFVSLYGLTDKDGLLKYPVFECTGNHDRLIFATQQALPGKEFVGGEVSKRHGGLTYSWDWEGVHMVCLDIYPDANNVKWLKKDLAAIGKNTPVVIYFHYAISGPFSDWWKDAEKDAFAKAIEGYNIISIFHGHYHSSRTYKWNSLDVFNIGSPRHAAHRFLVVHVTDTTMSVASWDWDNNRWDWSIVRQIKNDSTPKGR